MLRIFAYWKLFCSLNFGGIGSEARFRDLLVKNSGEPAAFTALQEHSFAWILGANRNDNSSAGSSIGAIVRLTFRASSSARLARNALHNRAPPREAVPSIFRMVSLFIRANNETIFRAALQLLPSWTNCFRTIFKWDHSVATLAHKNQSCHNSIFWINRFTKTLSKGR